MSTTTLTDSEKRERLKELVGDFDTAMLVTRTEDGGLRARPLSIAHNEDDQAGLYFSTAIDSPKVRELEADPRVNVCMQDKRRFVSVTGVARLVKDRALIDAFVIAPLRDVDRVLQPRRRSRGGRRAVLAQHEQRPPLPGLPRCAPGRQPAREALLRRIDKRHSDRLVVHLVVHQT